MTTPDSRLEVNEAIDELEIRALTVVGFLMNEMPDVVREVLHTEVTDIQNAVESLKFVLEDYYTYKCTQCEQPIKLEYPDDEVSCETCTPGVFAQID